MTYAVPGYFACGASAKVDGYTTGVDDVGMVGLRILFCKRLDTTVNYYETVYDDTDGNFPDAAWTDFYQCPEKNFMFGVQLQT